KHQAMILWGGWLLIGAAFFSVAGFFHPYYLSTLAPALAAVVGIAAIELWRLREKHPWLGLGLIALSTGGALGFEIANAAAFVNAPWWTVLAVGLYLIGVVLLIPLDRKLERVAMFGLACIIAALLLTPGIWSGLTTLNSNGNDMLPAAYDAQSTGQPNQTSLQLNQSLLAYLQANTQGMKYLMAVPSSHDGSDYVLATGRGVLYLGGFNGQDQVETSASLAKLVANGDLRYVYWTNGGGGPGGPGNGNSQSDISNWLTTSCKVVQGVTTSTSGFNRGPGGGQGTLYDCVG
ncbi:MAG: hypothetical protein WCF84_24300, partial [Anaerolineae bacterium]